MIEKTLFQDGCVFGFRACTDPRLRQHPRFLSATLAHILRSACISMSLRLLVQLQGDSLGLEVWLPHWLFTSVSDPSLAQMRGLGPACSSQKCCLTASGSLKQSGRCMIHLTAWPAISRLCIEPRRLLPRPDLLRVKLVHYTFLPSTPAKGTYHKREVPSPEKQPPPQARTLFSNCPSAASYLINGRKAFHRERMQR